MSVTINRDNFPDGGSQLSDIIEMAELAGERLIKVISTKPRSTFKMGMFNTLKRPHVRGSAGVYGVEPVRANSPLSMYQDVTSKYCIGLVLDTEANRIKLAQQLKHNTIRPIAKDVLEEIKKVAIKTGNSVAPVSNRNLFIERTKEDEKLIRKAEFAEKQAEAQKLAAQEREEAMMKKIAELEAMVAKTTKAEEPVVEEPVVETIPEEPVVETQAPKATRAGRKPKEEGTFLSE
jgi:hypothetical protein